MGNDIGALGSLVVVEWYIETVLLSHKKVRTAYRYKDRNRVMPGAVFTVNGIVHTLKGTQGRYKGQPSYYVSEDGTKHKCKNCSIQKHNSGINFLQEVMV